MKSRYLCLLFCFSSLQAFSVNLVNLRFDAPTVEDKGPTASPEELLLFYAETVEDKVLYPQATLEVEEAAREAREAMDQLFYKPRKAELKRIYDLVQEDCAKEDSIWKGKKIGLFSAQARESSGGSIYETPTGEQVYVTEVYGACTNESRWPKYQARWGLHDMADAVFRGEVTTWLKDVSAAKYLSKSQKLFDLREYLESECSDPHSPLHAMKIGIFSTESARTYDYEKSQKGLPLGTLDWNWYSRTDGIPVPVSKVFDACQKLNLPPYWPDALFVGPIHEALGEAHSCDEKAPIACHIGPQPITITKIPDSEVEEWKMRHESREGLSEDSE